MMILRMTMMLSIQSCLAPHLLIWHHFFEFWYALSGVSFDVVHSPCFLMAWFPSTCNSFKHNCFLRWIPSSWHDQNKWDRFGQIIEASILLLLFNPPFLAAENTFQNCFTEVIQIPLPLCKAMPRSMKLCSWMPLLFLWWVKYAFFMYMEFCLHTSWVVGGWVGLCS